MTRKTVFRCQACGREVVACTQVHEETEWHWAHADYAAFDWDEDCLLGDDEWFDTDGRLPIECDA